MIRFSFIVEMISMSTWNILALWEYFSLRTDCVAKGQCTYWITLLQMASYFPLDIIYMKYEESSMLTKYKGIAKLSEKTSSGQRIMFLFTFYPLPALLIGL